ncbi:NADH:flavin oxidoreductase (plasmid) [Agrobacterium tumefaciens]|uniref:oxidoreductase n=1 Tax=Agrobacterium tumefaciens TaxID=358 RepID=UPI0015721C5F|nr:NADH:flavin oxidoreductase [Agrobacterium tumefaciens]WCA62388.1 NADH:flavin oxidoreductase [Agrobacterium tumefaciens]
MNVGDSSMTDNPVAYTRTGFQLNEQFFEPYTFNNGATVKNRLFMAPMTNGQSHTDGRFSEEELHWLAMRAQGGFGAVISAGAAPYDDDLFIEGQIGTFSDDHEDGLRRFAETAKREQALSIVQLMPSGMRAKSKLNRGRQPAGPSVVRLPFPDFEEPKELSEEQIHTILNAFVESAQRVHRAGASGIELHGANGYLFTQFFSLTTNLRTDKWGGSVENRARFLLEAMRKIRASLPNDFILGVKILVEDWSNGRGFDIDDGLEMLRMMNDVGFNYLNLSAMNAKEVSWKYPDQKQTNLSRVRSVLRSDIPVVASGSLITPQDVQDVLNDGADMVALGRAAILAPDWPKRAARPDFEIKSFPLTTAELNALGVSPKFLYALRNGLSMWKFIKE